MGSDYRGGNMGKSSNKTQVTNGDLKQEGPGLSDPGLVLQLTSLGSMPTGPIDFANGGFAAQLAALPKGLKDQIAAAGKPATTPAPAAAPQDPHQTFWEFLPNLWRPNDRTWTP